MSLESADAPQLWEIVSDGLSRVRPEDSALFLAKLVLLLCYHLGDLALVASVTEQAHQGLDPSMVDELEGEQR